LQGLESAKPQVTANVKICDNKSISYLTDAGLRFGFALRNAMQPCALELLDTDKSSKPFQTKKRTCETERLRIHLQPIGFID
jgi:hypothetical protein